MIIAKNWREDRWEVGSFRPKSGSFDEVESFKTKEEAIEFFRWLHGATDVSFEYVDSESSFYNEKKLRKIK